MYEKDVRFIFSVLPVLFSPHQISSRRTSGRRSLEIVRTLKSLLIGVAFFPLLSIAAAPDRSSPDPQARAELTALVEAWIDAEVRSDRGALENILHPNFLSTFASGTTLRRDAYIDFIVGLDIAPFSVRNETMQIYGDTAVVIDVSTDGRTKFTWIAVKREGRWQVIAQTFSSVRQRSMTELTEMANQYAAAWSGQDPVAFASFYAENGVLRINDGEPAVGREAVTETARSFMTAFPDMVVELVELRKVDGYIEFHWRWTGTNTGPGGTGNAVELNGFERWTLDASGLILESLRHLDDAEYQRQLNAGVAGASDI